MDIPGLEYGPWESCGITVRTEFRPDQQDRPGFLVADLSGSPLNDRTAIAKLIASAPAMAEALQDVSDCLIAVDGWSHDPDDVRGWSHPELCVAYRQIRAVLAALQTKESV
jgi:hypothetical protein